jgi:hypothetical protein
MVREEGAYLHSHPPLCGKREIVNQRGEGGGPHAGHKPQIIIIIIIRKGIHFWNRKTGWS